MHSGSQHGWTHAHRIQTRHATKGVLRQCRCDVPRGNFRIADNPPTTYLLCFSQPIRMTQSTFPFAMAQIAALLLFTIASHAQPTDSQSRATAKPQAETIKIKLVNGRNGQPIPASYVNVWVGTERKEAIVIPTDGKGVASLQLTLNTAEINIPNPSNNRGSVVVPNPVVKYDDSLRINAGYVLCQPHVGDYSWLKTMDLTTSRVLQEGITMANTCGTSRATAKPGEVIIFVRPLNWWEKLKE